MPFATDLSVQARYLVRRLDSATSDGKATQRAWRPRSTTGARWSALQEAALRSIRFFSITSNPFMLCFGKTGSHRPRQSGRSVQQPC